MDDQNIAVASETDARRIVRQLTTSLSEQRLVLNSAKTKFLSPEGVSDFFHLDTNENLDQINDLIANDQLDNLVQQQLDVAWIKALTLENSGNWDKILKRFYGLAGRLRMPFLLERAFQDLVRFPLLASRIFDYYSALGDFAGLLQLFEQIVQNEESLYESVETAFFENILLNNIPNTDRSTFRQFTQQWIANPKLGSGRPYSRGSAALCLYWLGDRRSIPTVRKSLENDAKNYPATTSRALVATLVALAPEQVDQALNLCARLGNPELAAFAQFVEVIRRDTKMNCSLSKVSQRRPFSVNVSIFEARTWLRLEILTLASSPAVTAWLESQYTQITKSALGDCEQRAFRRWSARI